MKIIECDVRHASSILAILNDAILHSTVLYDYKPRTMEMMKTWFEAKGKGGYPVIGIEDGPGELIGFASYGSFRPWPAYKYSVEHSVYVDARYRGRGFGRALMLELIKAATSQDYHTMIGGIDAANVVSVALHRSLGFEYCGTVKQVGFKFGRWLDLDFYQLILSTPAHPVEE
jgi:L-amino acid N-acyltransferase